MKSSYLLASLALGSTTLARLIPRAELDNRQWTCRWTGHCLGDECQTNRDCDGDLICRDYECANPGSPVKPTTTKKTTTARPTTTVVPPGCVWPGHCLGDPCKTENDCDSDWVCLAGKCSVPGGTVPVPIPTTTRRTTTSTIRPPIPPTTTTRVVPPPITTTSRPIIPPITTRTTARPTTTSKPPTTPGNPNCGDNPLACIGSPCSTDADCKFELIICKNGVCGL
ncbi:hypothetical protein B0T20DRAFT_219484 [Sordaria brevicollis]|uniref:Uncharacterized protein n=1 Tax=Sordaria brevicollis TaxID=83679 RepID=A0AAE0PF90_SORBR|nr:hypothetical protein B0T20DRAFT_219484 [Sordaria brevicollis]